MDLTCNADAYSRTLQSQSEFRGVSNTKLSETEATSKMLRKGKGKACEQDLHPVRRESKGRDNRKANAFPLDQPGLLPVSLTLT
jgi:hypothetical protein